MTKQSVEDAPHSPESVEMRGRLTAQTEQIAGLKRVCGRLLGLNAMLAAVWLAGPHVVRLIHTGGG